MRFLVSGRDGLQNLRVTDAIAEAAKTGQVINLPINRGRYAMLLNGGKS
jgi:hypothetical protein